MKKLLLILIFAGWAIRGGGATEAYEPPVTNTIQGAVVPYDPAPPKTPAPTTKPRGQVEKSVNSAAISSAKAEVEKKAGMGKYRKIIDRAPFRNNLVPSTVAGAPTGNSALKLNGIIRIGNRLLAGIEDSGQQRSMILSVGQNDQGIEIQAIDEASQTVTLTHNGQAATLVLEKTPSIGSGPALLAGTPPGSPNPIPPQIGPAYQPLPGATNAAPAQNTRRRKNLIVPRTQ